MKFLVDAQLPYRLAELLRDLGYDARHTLDLPEANRTSDQTVISIADQESRIVVTKDADFVRSFTLHSTPALLLLITTGNIANSQLLSLLKTHILSINKAFADHHFVEIGHDYLIIHE